MAKDRDRQPFARNEAEEQVQQPQSSAPDAHYRGDAADELSMQEEANHDLAKKELEQQKQNSGRD
ncbi:hypothetical protein CR205_14000 [Alteribacter lacisalsi]|uniref:Uncharacterized protein n=1 Tax=Alteribacter lacisalsi TaxID=2045244 RepID=A0A2W0H727_9BACI|nr:hypothetical protein [Alteribacter lacisalsi]PYZ96791.1 hypothetical protein CR205_14000 [Alteribacter lacisalsi]